MKHILSVLVLAVAAIMAISCGKGDYISPEELFNNSSKVANITIKTKSEEPGDIVTTFRDVSAYRESEYKGQSWLVAMSEGRMVYDSFMLSLYFGDIDKMKVGEALKVSRSLFSFIASSDSRASTDKYEGKLILADKGEDYAIIHFVKVKFECSLGTYLIDGYLYCPLFDKFVYR